MHILALTGGHMIIFNVAGSKYSSTSFWIRDFSNGHLFHFIYCELHGSELLQETR